jgi:Heavy-metal resistance protein CzcE
MKMKLVITGALAVLFSCAALADPEADFWQQPKSFSYSTRDDSRLHGTPAETDSADRTVRLGPGAQSVNVGRGETVRFIVQDGSGSQRSFVWRFDGSPSTSDVDPSKAAPAGFPVHDVYILFTPDSRNGGG